MNRSYPFAGIWKDVLASRWCDATIIFGLILFASFSFYVTPEFAANLPGDGEDFASIASTRPRTLNPQNQSVLDARSHPTILRLRNEPLAVSS